jgi:histidinol phosphatase-like enzyme
MGGQLCRRPADRHIQVSRRCSFTCRKPKPGMIFAAAARHGINYLVGDC